MKKPKNSHQTNFRIVIENKYHVQDGEGYAPDVHEATRRFKSVISKCNELIRAELWYEGRLIKKV